MRFSFSTRVFPKPFGATSAWEDKFIFERNSSTSVVRSNTELCELLKSLSSVSCCASSTHAGIPASAKSMFRREARRVVANKTETRRIGPRLILHQVRASLARDTLGLGATPRRDLGVVAREEHVRNCAALPFARAGVVRILEQPALEAFLGARLLLPHHAGNEPHAGVENGKRSDFAARQHIIADRHLDEAARRDHPFVHALEAGAQDDEAGSRRPLPRLSLPERRSAWTHDQARARIVHFDGRVEARAQKISPHQPAG